MAKNNNLKFGQDTFLSEATFFKVRGDFQIESPWIAAEAQREKIWNFEIKILDIFPGLTQTRDDNHDDIDNHGTGF